MHGTSIKIRACNSVYHELLEGYNKTNTTGSVRINVTSRRVPTTTVVIEKQ